MKKALVVLLILAVAGGAFAQLTFSGHIRSGIGITITDADGVDPAFTNWMAGDGLASRLDFQASFTHADGNAGGRILLRADYNGSATNLGVQNIEAWFKAMDGMITIYAGKIDNGGYGTGGGIDTNLGNHGGTGMFINVAPMPGLGIRAGVYPVGTGGYAFDNSQRLENARYSFGVTYTAPNVVTVVALLRNGEGAIYNRTDAALGIKVLALASMGLTTLNVDFALMDLQKAVADKITIQIGEQLQYVSGDLTIGGRFMQQLESGDAAADDLDLSFAVWLQYVMGNIVPRLDAGFNMGTALGWGSATYRGNWDGVSKGGFNADNKHLVLMPSVAFRFGSANHYLKLGYSLGMDMSDPEPAVKMRNTIFVDYRVNF